MRNRILFVLIIIAAIFPFAATGFELAETPIALIALGAMSLIAIAITVGAMMYRPKPNADVDTPKQAIVTIRQAPPVEPVATRGEAKPAAKKPAVAPEKKQVR